MQKKRTKRKTIKKYTLAEFKAWLEGIEEIQPDDWCPDVTQWQMIRDKIGSIIEPSPPVVLQQRQQTIPPVVSQLIPATGQYPVSSFIDETGQPNKEMPGTTLDMTPAAKAALGGKLPSEMAGDTTHRSITPEIDTADGNYESNFT